MGRVSNSYAWFHGPVSKPGFVQRVSISFAQSLARSLSSTSLWYAHMGRQGAREGGGREEGREEEREGGRPGGEGVELVRLVPRPRLETEIIFQVPQNLHEWGAHFIKSQS